MSNKGIVQQQVVNNNSAITLYKNRVEADGGEYIQGDTKRIVREQLLDGIYQSAVLSLLPNGRKAGKQFSMKPTDGTGDFTVARASDTATEINEQGYIQSVLANVPRYNWSSGVPVLITEPAATNLVAQSEAFVSDYWAKSGATIEGDPSTAGEELVINGDMSVSESWIRSDVVISENVATFNGVVPYIEQDIGAVAETSYMVTYTVVSGTSSTLSLSSASFTGATLNIPRTFGTHVVYALASNTNNLRIIAAAATNLVITDVSVKEVSGFPCPMVDSSGDNTLQGYKLVEDESAVLHSISTGSIGLSSGNNYTVSVFVKKGERDIIRITEPSFTAKYAEFNLSTLSTTTTGISSEIKEYIGGWYKCSMTYIAGSNGTFRISLGSSSYQGDGTSGIYIFGAQLEVGTATSYIQTTGTTETRNADAVTGAGDATLFSGVNESGVLYAEIAANSDDAVQKHITLGSGTIDQSISLYYDNTEGKVSAYVDADITIYLSETGIDIANSHKIAVRYKSGDLSLWIDGNIVDSKTSTYTLTTPFEYLSLKRGDGAQPFYGKTKELMVLPYLTDAEMITLTTP